MSQQTHHIALLRLLRTLRTRDLTTEEWTQLDNYAAVDPFLRDAIDGLKQLPGEIRRAHLQALASKLLSKQKKRTVSNPVWIAAAASVLLIATIWGITRIDWTDHNQVAQQTQSTGDSLVESETGVSNAEGYQETGLILPPESSLTTRARQEMSASSEAKPSMPATSRSAVETSELSAHDDLAHTDAASNPQATPSQPAMRQLSKPSSAAGEESGIMDAQVAKDDNDSDDRIASSPEVRGIVMNNLGEPLPGVPIQVKGTRAQTQTDFLGNFAMDVPHSPDQNSLVIMPAGYAPVETNFVEGDSLVIRLLENTTTGKAEITTLAQRSATKASRPADRALAIPQIGERSYNKYIRQNLRYPSLASGAGIHGTVLLEFDLTSDGTPSEFRILRSLGYGCDEEAIRLIQEGPKWTISQVPVGRWEIQF